jgi:hypothetical protein
VLLEILSFLKPMLFALLVQNTLGLNCSRIENGGSVFDISALFSVNQNISLAQVSHENISVDKTELLINLCRPLGKIETIDEKDQCPDTSYACRFVTNWKNSQPRITSVTPIGKEPEQFNPDTMETTGVFFSIVDEKIVLNVRVDCIIGGTVLHK